LDSKKVVLVTGSTSTIGRQLIEHLAARGCIVYAGARNPEKLTKKVNYIRPITLDITVDNDCKTAIQRIVDEEGRIDVLINNAAYTLTGPITDFNAQDYINLLDTNVVGAFRLLRCVYTHMKQQKSGRIINITSLNGLVSLPNFSLYSSSKFALEALGLALRQEWQQDGIWITNVAPGALKSELQVGDQGINTDRTARQKFWILRILMPMVTQKKVVEKIATVIYCKTPPARVILGMDAHITTFLNRVLSSTMWDLLLRFVWNKK
jgi:NAD(P)-dependent dehydrogenase (short-subunit alcohol dehydrogenase family)